MSACVSKASSLETDVMPASGIVAAVVLRPSWVGSCRPACDNKNPLTGIVGSKAASPLPATPSRLEGW